MFKKYNIITATTIALCLMIGGASQGVLCKGTTNLRRGSSSKQTAAMQKQHQHQHQSQSHSHSQPNKKNTNEKVNNDRSLQIGTDPLVDSFTEEALIVIVENLSAEQRQLAQDLFTAKDVEQQSSGLLTYSELKYGGFAAFAAADLDNDYRLTFDEFLRWLVLTGVFSPPPPMPTGTLEGFTQEQRQHITHYEEWFHSMDQNQDALVTKTELDQYLPAGLKFRYGHLYDAAAATTTTTTDTGEAGLNLESFILEVMQQIYPQSIFGSEQPDPILAMFRSVDANEDGYLDESDYGDQDLDGLRDIIQSTLDLYDYNADLRVSYTEFFVGERSYM